MTELEYVEIEGFKGLEHVEFEPTDVNLITGRNNTGKTSFLEAVDLSSNPRKIRGFEENAGALIRRGFSEAVIETETASGADELVIRPASNEEVDRYFREAIRKHLKSIIQTGQKHSRNQDDISISGYSMSTAVDDEEIPEKFYEVIATVVTRITDQKIPDCPKNTLVLEFRGREYPFLYFGQNNRELLARIDNELGNILVEEFDEKEWEKHPNSYVVQNSELENGIIGFETRYSSVLRGGLFIEEPRNEEYLKFIRSVDLIDRIEDVDNEDDALRVDDIGDFLKEKEIVDRLKTFNLETLIFEDGGKYPVPYDFMGDGFKSMVGLLWELMDDEMEDQIVLIEEPETHMHPGYIREVVYFLIQLAREEDIQLFITTHDSDFINDFFTENLTDEEESYLEDEFSLLRMEEDSAVVEDYETARENLKDLHLDLRGI